MADPLFDTLAVVGMGLIGGSVGLAARRRGTVRHVLGVGRDPAALDRARAIGAATESGTDLTEAAARADLVVFCTPIDVIAGQVLAVAPHCRPGTVLTDAGSTKADIVAALDGKLPAGVAFVGGHPLAGSEKSGCAYARADLFEGRAVVLTPTPATDPSALARISAFWQALGARVQCMVPEAHDRALALTSHLPHLLAAALAGLLPPAWRGLTAGGFRDTTRIAAGEPGLWSAIFLHNRGSVRDALDQFRARLDAFAAALQAEDRAALDEFLSQAKQVRDALGG